MEPIGKVFSHVRHECILGYKAPMPCRSDGRTQFMPDASLHGGKGKAEGRGQGLTAGQRRKRYRRERDAKSHAALRMKEYLMGKGGKLIGMVKDAIRLKIPFGYLPVDSRFTNTGLVDFVCGSRKRFRLPDMAEMGKTKYATQWGDMTARAIPGRLSSLERTGYSRRHRIRYAMTDAKPDTRKIRLFFCRRSKSEGWRILPTTGTSIEFMRAYEIYAMRRSIEVFFSDSKRLPGLSDRSARDFTSQPAHVSLVMIRYNLPASLKRSLDYETIGGLFNDVYAGVYDLTVVEKIRAIIIEVWLSLRSLPAQMRKACCTNSRERQTVGGIAGLRSDGLKSKSET